MTYIRAFKPYVVEEKRSTSVVSPAYDSMSSDERRDYRISNPDNYINVMQTIDDSIQEKELSEDQILRENAENLQHLLSDGAYRKFENDSLFVYELSIEGHSQIGIVAEIPVSEYQVGQIRKHEETRKEHEERLSKYLNVVGASSSPICLAYEGSPIINSIVGDVVKTSPILDFPLPDGVHQRLWRIDDINLVNNLHEAFMEVDATYLTDGHHRAASTLRHATDRRSSDNESGPWDYLLAALFPSDQLRVLPYNRCVRDLWDNTPQTFLDSLQSNFTVEEVPEIHANALPCKSNQFLMLMEGKYILLTLREPTINDSPVKNLDVSLLQDLILSPLLGIKDVRGDPRLDYVTGDSGIAGLRQRCSEGWALGFACFPTSLAQLMAVADAEEAMPPKSTCFDPKPRSGIFVRLS